MKIGFYFENWNYHMKLTGKFEQKKLPPLITELSKPKTLLNEFFINISKQAILFRQKK